MVQAPVMEETEPMVPRDRTTTLASQPMWLALVRDRRRYERLLGLVLWFTLFAVIFDFGW